MTDDFYCDEALSGRTPIEIVEETDDVLAFYHTRPFWPVHIVIVPKQHVPSLVDLGDFDERLVHAVLAVVGRVAERVTQEYGACRVVTNLGQYQDSKHLHFHVSSGAPIQSNLVFIQMAGVPGSGKTTVATVVAERIGAVVIDHDVTKTALLNAGVPIDTAGRASYAVLNDMAEHLLNQSQSVIFDSPCYYEELLEKGQRLAQEAGATYKYIECVINDPAELDRRLRTRTRLRSQVVSLNSPPVDIPAESWSSGRIFEDGIANQVRPKAGCLVLDTSRPIEENVEEAVAYVHSQPEIQVNGG